MYERLKRLFLAGDLTEAQLGKAVTLGWITEAQKQAIIDAKVLQDLG